MGPRGRSGRVRKISSPPGFDPRTVQPVASGYTDCDIPTPTWQLPSASVFPMAVSNASDRYSVATGSRHVYLLNPLTS